MAQLFSTENYRYYNSIPFPTLVTERLVLRAITVADVNEVLKLRSDKTVIASIDRPLAVSPADAMDLIEKITDAVKNNEGITWAIAFIDEPAFIGIIRFWTIDKKNLRAKIGYMLHTRQQ